MIFYIVIAWLRLRISLDNIKNIYSMPLDFDVDCLMNIIKIANKLFMWNNFTTSVISQQGYSNFIISDGKEIKFLKEKLKFFKNYSY